MNDKSKKGAKIAINIVVGIIIVLVLIVAINTLISGKKGYTSFFGLTSYAVKTESMKGDNKDSFNEGDLIFVKVLKTDYQKSSLKEGDVITFWDIINNKKELNTHRITSKHGNEAIGFQYKTRGDNNLVDDAVMVDYREVVGVYSGKIKGLGKATLFVKSPTGFLVFIVIPSLLVLIYCIFMFIKNYKVFATEKAQIALKSQEDKLDKEAEKEALRQEILNELSKEKTEKEKDDTK